MEHTISRVWWTNMVQAVGRVSRERKPAKQSVVRIVCRNTWKRYQHASNDVRWSHQRDYGTSNEWNWKDMKGVPWKLRPRMDETIDSSIVILLPEVKERLTPITERWWTKELLYVRKKDLLKADGTYEYTPGRPGCEVIMVGMPAIARNADCRMRVTHLKSWNVMEIKTGKRQNCQSWTNSRCANSGWTRCWRTRSSSEWSIAL